MEGEEEKSPFYIKEYSSNSPSCQILCEEEHSLCLQPPNYM